MQSDIRKIAKVNYSFTITLPLEWIKTTKAEHGSRVLCHQRKDGSLVITKVDAEEVNQ
jgi:bifunctional DNA-binding transcriptional regulator/antitoxin component of YhaV-PrlF toxin-antitoxin module